MKNNLSGTTFLSLIFVFILSGLSVDSFAQKSQIFRPSDVPVPVLDSTGFLIDPEKKIDEEWRREIIFVRETYFFNRYIEPVCVRIDNIREPDDLDAFADKLVELWDLEKKTNGRFVFQIHCKSKKKVVFRIGSRLKPYYLKPFLTKLAADIEAIHFAGDAVGTGDFVSIQKMGDHIFKEIKYDSKLSTYQGNTGIHTYYPDRVERSNGELQNLSWSPYAPDDPIFVQSEGDVIIESEGEVLIENGIDASMKNYYSGSSQSEIDENFASINTNGKITDIHKVPNARELNNTHVTDPHNMLSSSSEDLINGLLNSLEDSLGYQVAVVCLNSIGDNDARVWGTDLFNLWGIGSKETENGLLMLLIHDIHGIDFITGRGTEGILTDVDCYNIQQQEMVPHFKNNDYATGMIRGTQAVCDFFYGSPPIYSVPSTDEVYDTGYEEPYYEEEPYNFFKSDIWGIYVMSTGIMTAAWLVVFIICFFIRDLHKRYFTLKFFSLKAWPFAFPVPFALLYFLNKSMMERWRNTTRFSPTTGEEMHKLDDHAEDKHLAKGQLTEEKIKSIDYDVWVSYGGKEVLVLAYKKWFSKYNACPSCKFKTYWKEYDRTITAATYDSTGTGERKYKCESCGHSKTERYTIARKTRSSSSSGGSSYGGGSRSSFSGGGSSYGGGSSRGGGSGSRW